MYLFVSAACALKEKYFGGTISTVFAFNDDVTLLVPEDTIFELYDCDAMLTLTILNIKVYSIKLNVFDKLYLYSNFLYESENDLDWETFPPKEACQ